MKLNILFSILLVVKVSSQETGSNCELRNNLNLQSLSRNPEVQNVYQQSDNFNLALFNLIAKSTTDNVFMSPFSIWSALALAYYGSGGNTEAELQNTLQLAKSKTNSQAGVEILNQL